jgi:hypothetical protein
MLVTKETLAQLVLQAQWVFKELLVLQVRVAQQDQWVEQDQQVLSVYKDQLDQQVHRVQLVHKA